MPYDATPQTYTNLNNFNNNTQPYSNVQQYRPNNPTTLPSYPDRPNVNIRRHYQVIPTGRIIRTGQYTQIIQITDLIIM